MRVYAQDLAYSQYEGDEMKKYSFQLFSIVYIYEFENVLYWIYYIDINKICFVNMLLENYLKLMEYFNQTFNITIFIKFSLNRSK